MEKCIICNNTHFQLIYNELLKKCVECNYIVANLDFNNLNLEDIYTENYFNGEEYDNYKEDREGITKNFTQRINRILKLVKPSDLTSILEIGCAYGFFGDSIIKKIPSAKYLGMDVATEAIGWGRTNLNLDLYDQDYLLWQTNQKPSDIFLWDVIEHLKNPEFVIEKAYQDLEFNGRIYITTGDIGALLPRLQKSRWRMIHPPSHLHYFSKKTLSRLLEKNGFKIIDVSYPSIWRSLKQIYFSLFILNKKKRNIHNWIHKTIPSSIYIPMNTYDIMMIIGQKK